MAISAKDSPAAIAGLLVPVSGCALESFLQLDPSWIRNSPAGIDIDIQVISNGREADAA